MAAASLTDRVPDDELLRRAAAGDASSFTELFRWRQPDVFRFAVHMTGSVATAEDVVQDVFMIVMRDGARYESGRATVVAWLCGIARNCVRHRLDRDRRLTSVEFAGDDREPASAAGGPMDPLADLLRAERIETLRRAVQTLPVPYREALALCDLQEMSYTDAAVALGCPVGTVRSRLHRARTMLAARLSVPRTSPAVSMTEAAAAVPARESASRREQVSTDRAWKRMVIEGGTHELP
jgi:RNA polymerase sigma-70 factor (ECF subfamily)